MNTAIAIPPTVDERYVKELPTLVVSELRTFTSDRQGEFFEEYKRRRKSGWWAWPLWLLGWHIVYMQGRWGRQFAYLLAFGITLGIWWLIEGFRLPRNLREQRKDVAIAAMRDVKTISSR